jgi:hypothetical protein
MYGLVCTSLSRAESVWAQTTLVLGQVYAQDAPTSLSTPREPPLVIETTFRLPSNIRTKLLVSFPPKSYIPLCFAWNIYPTPSLFRSGVLLLRIQVWSAVPLGIRRLQNCFVVGSYVRRCVVSRISIGLKICCIGNGGTAGEFVRVSQIIPQVIIHLHWLTEKIGKPLIICGLKFVKDIVVRFGIPHSVITNNVATCLKGKSKSTAITMGSAFTSHLWLIHSPTTKLSGPMEYFYLGLIRLKRIYNFLCSMLVYAPFALCFVYTSWRFYAFFQN